MKHDRFEATFRLRTGRDTAWRRLTADDAGSGETGHLWLPGFDSQVTVVDADPPERLRATKDDEPCAGTDILVTLHKRTRAHASTWPSRGSATGSRPGTT